MVKSTRPFISRRRPYRIRIICLEAADLAPVKLRELGHTQGAVPGGARTIRQERTSFLRGGDGGSVERGNGSFPSVPGVHAGDGVQ